MSLHPKSANLQQQKKNQELFRTFHNLKNFNLTKNSILEFKGTELKTFK